MPVQFQEFNLFSESHALETVIHARRREEQLRRETEAVLAGLRILLADLSYREKLEQLARHVARAILCDDVRLVQQRPGNRPRLILPQETLPEFRALENLLACHTDAGAAVFSTSSDDAALLRNVLHIRDGELVLLPLKAGAEHCYLVCRARSAMDQGARALAERMALLLEQALLLHADQNRMVHTAKLSALGQMSTSIAHELRQPLNTISITAQNIEMMAGRESIDAALLKERVARILGQVDRACQIMDRMRRFGRRTAGDYKPARLGGIVDGVRALMDDPLRQAGAVLDIQVPDDLLVFADELEIEQVLVNLIQNALDAMAGRKDSLIRIACEPDPGNADMVRLSVEDNGGGFAPEVLKHALDAFFTTKPEGKGTGLGLAIAHVILREHGGQLSIGNGRMGGLIILVLRRARQDAKVIGFAPAAGQAP